LTKAPSHRLLAMLRAENEGFIKFKVEVDLMKPYYWRIGFKETSSYATRTISHWRQLQTIAQSCYIKRSRKRKQGWPIRFSFATNLIAPPLGETNFSHRPRISVVK
jgi:uncharacterized protein